MSRSTDNSPSFTDAEQLGVALLAAADRLAGMCASVAKARTVLCYSGDRLKRALAAAVADAKAAHPVDEKGRPSSFASIESIALASTQYRDAVDALSAGDEIAERAVAEWKAAEVRWESLRTLVSLEKAKASML